VETSACRSCKAAVRWASTLKNRLVPLDAQPVHQAGTPAPENLAGFFDLASDGKAHSAMAAIGLVDEQGMLRRPLYFSHFVTCPQRDRWRKDQTKAKPA
jgi:hypothetical protein